MLSIFKRDSRALRIVLIGLLALALSAVSIASAQSTSTDLTQVAKTSDGQLSVRLPAGWLGQEASVQIYSSTLVFGDTATSLQGVVDSLTAATTVAVPGISGVIAIIDKQYTSSLDPTSGTKVMFTSVVSQIQQSGAEVLDQQAMTTPYAGWVAVAQDTSLATKGIAGVMASGTNIIVFQIATSPESIFDSSSDLLTAIVNSVSVPAEAGGSVPARPTPVPPTAVVQSGQTSTGGVTASATGMFSVRLPAGWATDITTTIDNFGDTVTFGSDQAALEASSSFLVAAQTLTAFQGVGGFVGAIQIQGFSGAQIIPLVPALVGAMTQSVTAAGAKAIGQAETHTFGGLYEGQLQQLDIGVVAVLHSADQVLVAILISDDPTANSDAINTVLESIHIPAEAGEAQPAPTEIPTELPTEAQAVPSSEIQTFRSSDARVSLDIPGDWTVLDHAADGDILAYGDSADAAMSRLYSVKPELATETVISGNGGVVVIYPMSVFGIDPHNPDLMPLMERALGNLSGYTVVQPPEALEGIEGGVIAVIGGTEQGYLALIPFDDQIAYVTATVSTDSFDSQQSALLDIVKSVHIPAIPESSGLGGLGGLEVPPTATPEPTQSGITGLGGLIIEPVATSEATEVVTPEETVIPPVVATPEVTPEVNG